jgi:hypothetical protein
MRRTAITALFLALTASAGAEEACEVFVDDESLAYVSVDDRRIAVERRHEHCVAVDHGESVSETRTFVVFTEVRSFDGRPLIRFVKTPSDGGLLTTAFGTADGAELRDAKTLAPYLAENKFKRPKAGPKSATGCVAALSAAVPFGETDAGIYTVLATVKGTTGANLLTKELGAASEPPGKRRFTGKLFWLDAARAFGVEAHMPQRIRLSNPASKTVAAGRVMVLTSDLIAECFKKP